MILSSFSSSFRRRRRLARPGQLSAAARYAPIDNEGDIWAGRPSGSYQDYQLGNKHRYSDPYYPPPSGLPPSAISPQPHTSVTPNPPLIPPPSPRP